jgi:crotonobetaine/carnitine-CoA ligase
MPAITLPPPERTLQRLIERQADAHGGRPCLRVGDVSLTYGELPAAAARFGGALAAAGIGRGDRLAIISENRWELLQCLLGCAWTGAMLVPINTASRGAQLQHILTNAAPKVVAAEAPLLARVAELDRPEEVVALWSIGEGAASWEGMDARPFPAPSDAVEATRVGPGDPLAILYTSGTTGPSKGVVCPHAQFYWWGAIVGGLLGVGEDDTLYTCLPLFHTNALNAFVQALMNGATFVVGPRFSASQFWQRVADADATVTYLLGAMVSILASQPERPAERSHRVRIALAPATAADLWDVFRTRFGIEIVDSHGMTETNAAIGPLDGEQRPGWMGRVLPGFDARVVDDDDAPVPDGTAGELVLRASEPYAFASGYWRMPEATVAAWRNLWFHSGDRVVREDGWFRFLDRMKDAIRRRGENVSAWEVEQALLQHEAVAAVAVIPVPSELGEDDIKAWIVRQAAATVSPEEIVRWCEERLAYFKVPRYVEFISQLPRGAAKSEIERHTLKARGIGQAWDRQAAGYQLRR